MLPTRPARSSYRRRPSPAMVVALIALFVALGGSSFAALKIGSVQLRDNGVRSRDIRDNDVRSLDIRNRTLKPVDFEAGALQAGPQGPIGPAGPPGAPGGVSGWELVTATSPDNSVSGKSALAKCPDGKRVIGLGFSIGGSGGDGGFMGAIEPNGVATVGLRGLYAGETAVVAEAFELPLDGNVGTTDTWNVQARAICANVG